jgi:hypothetical protein
VFSAYRLLSFLDHGLLLLVFGDMGKSPQLNFIFFTNTKYASRASTCVGNVLLRFIHIFRYLSELRSFRAAYHCASDVCFSTIARRLPPSPVTPLACFRQAAFNSEISVFSSDGSSTNEPILDGLFERTGFAGAIFGDAIFGDEVLEVFGADVFGVDVFEDEDFEEVFGDDVSGGAVFEDVGFGVFVFGDATFGDAIFGDSVLGRAVFCDSVFDSVFAAFFEDVVGDDAVFSRASFEGANFAVTIFEGTFGDGGGAT